MCWREENILVGVCLFDWKLTIISLKDYRLRVDESSPQSWGGYWALWALLPPQHGCQAAPQPQVGFTLGHSCCGCDSNPQAVILPFIVMFFSAWIPFFCIYFPMVRELGSYPPAPDCRPGAPALLAAVPAGPAQARTPHSFHLWWS